MSQQEDSMIYGWSMMGGYGFGHWIFFAVMVVLTDLSGWQDSWADGSVAALGDRRVYSLGERDWALGAGVCRLASTTRLEFRDVAVAAEATAR
jgi:hypothetical protein